MKNKDYIGNSVTQVKTKRQRKWMSNQKYKTPIPRKQHLSKVYVHKERDRETVKHIEWDIY